MAINRNIDTIQMTITLNIQTLYTIVNAKPVSNTLTVDDDCIRGCRGYGGYP